MSIQYVVPNFDRQGEVVEVFPIEAFFDPNGNRVADPEQATSLVVRDGACCHRFDASSVYVYQLH